MDTPQKFDDPLVWLLTLEMARQRNDFAQAATAERELKRLGIKVTYIAPRKKTDNFTGGKAVSHVG